MRLGFVISLFYFLLAWPGGHASPLVSQVSGSSLMVASAVLPEAPTPQFEVAAPRASGSAAPGQSTASSTPTKAPQPRQLQFPDGCPMTDDRKRLSTIRLKSNSSSRSIKRVWASWPPSTPPETRTRFSVSRAEFQLFFKSERSWPFCFSSVVAGIGQGRR